MPSELARRVQGQRAGLLNSARHCQAIQQQQGLAMVAQQRDTAFGRALGLERVKTLADYRQCVPIATWEDLEPWISRELAGEAGVFLPAPPLAVELTGGSTTGRKTIPYNARQLGAFRAAVLPWLDDWLTQWPSLANQRWWWAITPAGRAPSQTPGGIPVGLPGGDAAYFGVELAPLLLQRLVAPPQLAAFTDLALWQRATAALLLACEDLGLLSLWSPSLLVGLLDCLQAESELILDWLDHWPWADIPAPGMTPARRRALPDLIAAGPSALWPHLTFCSCWTAASAARDVASLQHRWPGLVIQGKGLLSTEGVVTVPLHGLAAPLLAINSGFFEFRTEDGQLLLAHQLQVGQVSEVVLSTWGGLLRYASGDRVQVMGYEAETPLLQFLGRQGDVSDLCGEKLTEAFVAGVLAATLPDFAMLLPNSNSRGYRLVLEAGGKNPAQICAAVDVALCANPQYAYARALGQLAPVEAWPVAAPLARLQRAALALGRRLGDLKPPALGGAKESAWFT